MKKILIVCSHYLDDTDANAICVRNLVKEFSKKNEIYIITDESNDSFTYKKNELTTNVHLYFVKSSFYETLLKKDVSMFRHLLLFFYSFFRRVINLFVFPNVSPIRTKKITSIAKSIINEKAIDYYLATYRPFESIVCGEKLKKHFCNVRFISYHLDNLDGHCYKSRIIARIIKNRIRYAFKRENKLYDRIFVTFTSHLSGDKTIKIGLPVYKKNESISFNYQFDNNYINIVYVGSLNKNNRNPEYAFSLFSRYNDTHDKKILVHLWGNTIGLSELLVRYKIFVIDNGPICNKYTQYIYENCDCVLNVGNKITTDMLPSKLFQVFATGKPIISFNKKEDKSIEYLRDYGNSILLSYDCFENDYKLLEESIELLNAVDNSRKGWDLFTPEKIAEVLLNEGQNEI